MRQRGLVMGGAHEPRLEGTWRKVHAALEHLRKNGEDSETLNVIPVVDDRGALIDDLRVRQLLLADPESRVEQLHDGSFIALRATDDQEHAVAHGHIL